MKMVLNNPVQQKRGNVQERHLHRNLLPSLYTERRMASITSLSMNYTHITHKLSLIATSTY